MIKEAVFAKSAQEADILLNKVAFAVHALQADPLMEELTRVSFAVLEGGRKAVATGAHGALQVDRLQ